GWADDDCDADGEHGESGEAMAVATCLRHVYPNGPGPWLQLRRNNFSREQTHYCRLDLRRANKERSGMRPQYGDARESIDPQSPAIHFGAGASEFAKRCLLIFTSHYF